MRVLPLISHPSCGGMKYGHPSVSTATASAPDSDFEEASRIQQSAAAFKPPDRSRTDDEGT